MAYDTGLAHRVRTALADKPVVEKKMFGGVGFMLQGNLCVGVHGADLIVRVGPEAYADCIAEPCARPFDLTGRPMQGWLFVSPEGVDLDEDLERWVAHGVAHALSLPAK